MTTSQLAAFFDHTLLKATAREADIRILCAEALDHGFATVCVQPVYVPLCAQLLKGSSVGVCTVVGFPLGVNNTSTKVSETKDVVQAGATEVDMVINVGWVLDGHWDLVTSEIRAIREAASPAPLKVILETCYLQEAQIARACQAAADGGALFVKTSTGFGTAGATVEQIRLMHTSIPAAMKVKASGGIRTLADVQAMLAAGADRIGASASVGILRELEGGSHANSGSGY